MKWHGLSCLFWCNTIFGLRRSDPFNVFYLNTHPSSHFTTHLLCILTSFSGAVSTLKVVKILFWTFLTIWAGWLSEWELQSHLFQFILSLFWSFFITFWSNLLYFLKRSLIHSRKTFSVLCNWSQMNSCNPNDPF